MARISRAEEAALGVCWALAVHGSPRQWTGLDWMGRDKGKGRGRQEGAVGVSGNRPGFCVRNIEPLCALVAAQSSSVSFAKNCSGTDERAT